MASAKKADAPSTSTAFDYSKFLPSDVKDTDLVILEGMTPIYGFKEALANEWDPIVGWVVGTELLPTLREGASDEYTPIMIRVQLANANKALIGKKGERKTVDVPAGEDVLVPVNGSIRIYKRLEAAIVDTKQVAMMIFRVTGTQETKHPSDLFLVEIVDTGKRQTRTGKFAFPSNEVILLNGETRQLTEGGAMINGATGEIVSHVPASAARA